MSYEAVPCMVRAPSQDGKGTILGVIIRPSSSQEGGHHAVLQPPPGVIPIKGAKSIVIQPGSKRSLIISNEQIQKMVNGRGMRMSPHSLWSSLPSTSNPSVVSNQQSNLTSPNSTDSGLSPSSSRIHSGRDGIASSTPDSGIQSVPTTPPQTVHNATKTEETAEEETKFDDMPRLRPMDEEEATTCESSSIPPALDESSIWHTSECETSLPSSLINTSWNPEEIATQLLSMAAFDPRKIQEVTALMLQRSKEDVGKKEETERKRKKEKNKSSVGKKKQKMHYDEQIPSTSKCILSVKEENRDVSEEEHKRSEEETKDDESDLVLYRMAIKRRLLNKVEEMSDRIIDRFSLLSIGDSKTDGEEKSINPIFGPIQWEKVNARRMNLSDILSKEKREKKKTEENKRKESRKRRREDRIKEAKEGTKISKRRGEIEEDVYENINTNVITCSHPLPSLSHPLPCLCTRGGCLSHGECINRSLRSFCTSSSCRLPSCSNRLSTPSTLCFSKGILKTREPKKANDFLGEIVGEVITVSSLNSRFSPSSSISSPLRIFSFTPNHFIDCTTKGNITRFIRHSCQPNSVIQLWWESSVPHLCIFSRFAIASNAVITVDLSFLTPFPFECHCSSRNCHRFIPSSLSLLLHQSIIRPYSTQDHKLFLRRNLKERTINEEMKKKNTLYSLYLFIDSKFRRIDGKVNREYAAIFHTLRSASRKKETELFVSLISQMMVMSDDPVDTHSLSCVRNRLIRNNEKKEEEEKDKRRRNKNDPSQPSRFDLSYLHSGYEVGSYNPDEWNGGDRSTNDAVRCICGIMEEEGTMMECDKCHFWLHSDCIPTPSSDSFICPLCIESTLSPHGDVILKIQPKIRFAGCIYYKALENKKKMQIREHECVYVKKLTSDNHKKIIRNLDQKKGKVKEMSKDIPLMSEVDQEDTNSSRSILRVFRVERLFESPGGHRFLFGWYYARPHETFCDENRLFHPNEVFATNFYDTLPLDSIMGKCVVMDPSSFCEGRPIFPSYKENDVLVCEYQLDRNQRHFDKCKNSYSLNTEPYAFQKFEKVRSLQRCFTPFSYSSSSIPTEKTKSLEDTSHSLRQKSTKRINSIVNRLTSIRV